MSLLSKWLVLCLIAVAFVALWLLRDTDERSFRAPTDSVTASPGTVASVSADEAAPIDPQSLDAKRHWQSAFAMDVTGASEATLREAYLGIGEAFYDPRSRDTFVQQMHAALVEGVGQDEADFLVNVYTATDWAAVDTLITSRAAETGQNYNDFKLVAGLAHDALDADAIAQLVLDGTAAPEDLVVQLASNGRVKDIIALSEQQLIGDINYVNPVSGRNALGTLVQTIGFRSVRYDPATAAEAVESLIREGVAVKPASGGLDPLDYALQANRFDGAVKLAMARALIEAGAPIETSHYELLEAMADIEEKSSFEELLGRR